MLEKPKRIYSDFDSSEERTVVLRDLRKRAKADIMVDLDPKRSATQRIFQIRGRKAFKAIAQMQLKNILEEEKLIAEYEKQKQKEKKKTNVKKERSV